MTTAPPPSEGLDVPPLSGSAQALYQWLFVSTVLVLVFVVAAVLIVRWGRHHRARMARRRREPTATEDVWQMHRLPDE